MRSRALVGLAFLSLVFLYSWRLGARSMWEPDEPRYAEIAREMVVSGDWIEPRLDFLKYYEKPPLTYWTTAVSFVLFGLDETAARLGPLLAAFLFIAGTAFLGRKLYDARTAVLGAFLLALSPLAWVTGRLLLTDIFLAAGVVWGVAGYAMALGRKERGASVIPGMVVAGLGLTAAWLAKGPIGIVLPLLGVVPCRALAGRNAAVGARGWLTAGAILAALGAPWFIAICLRDPSFASFFFFHEHVLRYFTPEAQRSQPWFFYLLVLLVGLFPGSMLVPWAAFRTWPGIRPASREDRGTCLLFGLAFLTLLLFTLSHSKLPTYVLPAAPAFALLVARGLCLAVPGGGGPAAQEGSDRLPRGLRISLAAAAFLSIAAALAVGRLAMRPPAPLLPDRNLLIGPLLLAVLAVLLVYAAFSGTPRALRRSVLPIAAVSFLSLMGSEMLLERLDAGHSVKEAALFVRSQAGPEDLIASYGRVLHGLTFYTQRRTAIIGGAGELSFGSRNRAHQGWIVPADRLLELLADRRVFIVLPAKLERRALESSGGRLKVLLRTPAYSVLSNT